MDEAVARLRNNLRNEPKWIKVHAAEHLLDIELAEGVRQQFLSESREYGEEPQYRVVIYRILARCAETDWERDEYVGKIVDAACDANGTDRLSAVESLAKLNVPFDPKVRQAIIDWTAVTSVAESPFGYWLLAINAEGPEREEWVQSLLSSCTSSDAYARLRAAHALDRLQPLPEPINAQVRQLGLARLDKPFSDNPVAAMAEAYLLSTAWRAAVIGQSEDAAEFRSGLKKLGNISPALGRIYLDQLAKLGSKTDIDETTRFLSADDADLAASAAYALLRIANRKILQVGVPLG